MQSILTLQPTRNYVMEGPMKKSVSGTFKLNAFKTYFFYLFNDVLLYTGESRLQPVIILLYAFFFSRVPQLFHTHVSTHVRTHSHSHSQTRARTFTRINAHTFTPTGVPDAKTRKAKFKHLLRLLDMECIDGGSPNSFEIRASSVSGGKTAFQVIRM
jgi:membrane glycosyltransferase